MGRFDTFTSLAVRLLVLVCLLGSFTTSKLSAISYSTATDTTDSDFNAGLVKSSVTVVGSGEAAYVEISTTTAGFDGKWLDGWSYRRTINISNSGASGLSDYQVWIPTTSFGSDWNDIKSKAKADMDDFRFTPSTATTTIPYWIEPNTGTPKGFWVKVSTLPAGANTIYMYYGNTSAGTGSNMSNTNILYDDFNDGYVNSSIWAALGNVTESAGILNITGNGASSNITSNQYFSPGTSIEWYGQVSNTTLSYHYNGFESPGPTFFIKWQNNPNIYARHNDTDLGTIGYTAPNTATWKIIWFSNGKAQWYRNGAQVFTTETINTTSCRVYFHVYDNGLVTTLDWIRVRKYAATEPTVSSVGSEQRPYFPSGELQSRVHDTTEAGTVWGEISWGENNPAGTDIKLKTRTGDTATPDGSWSSWYPSGDEWYEVATGTPIGSPRARYIQYISSFTTTVSTSTPQLLEVNIQFATNTATAPNLISPADDSWTTSTPVFDWDFVDEEMDTQQGYEVELSTDINFGVVNYSTGPYSSSVSSLTWPSPIADGRYYWRVKTQESYGKWSVWSSTYLVKIDLQPPTVAISSYSAVSSSQIKVHFTASDGESGLADTNPYFVEISQNPDMSGSTNSGWISQTEHTFSSLKRNGRYYFRVKAKDKADNIGTSSIIDWRTKPGAFQSKVSQGQPTRTGPNAFGFVGDATWEWDVPVKGGTLVTISAYIRYNTEYQGGIYDKPKLTLSGLGINESISATSSAENSWELRQLSGTPTSDGILTLKAEGFSTNPVGKFYVDDILINQ